VVIIYSSKKGKQPVHYTTNYKIFYQGRLVYMDIKHTAKLQRNVPPFMRNLYIH